VSLIENIINCQTRNWFKEGELASLLRKGELDQEYSVQVANFFTDVPLRAIVEFLERHGLSVEDLREYYRKHIKDVYPNRDLEEFLG
jgi:hypothetical protein